MAPQTLTLGLNPKLPGFWPSIASASAQLAGRRRSQLRRSGRTGNPAVLGRPSPDVLHHGSIDRSLGGLS